MQLITLISSGVLSTAIIAGATAGATTATFTGMQPQEGVFLCCVWPTIYVDTTMGVYANLTK